METSGQLPAQDQETLYDHFFRSRRCLSAKPPVRNAKPPVWTEAKPSLPDIPGILSPKPPERNSERKETFDHLTAQGLETLCDHFF